MNEKIKIISDGSSAEVWIDGMEVRGLRKVEFSQAVDEEARVTTEIVLIPGKEALSPVEKPKIKCLLKIGDMEVPVDIPEADGSKPKIVFMLGEDPLL